MWKAAFSGRSESGSTAGRSSSQKKKSSGSVVSSVSRDDRRKSGRSSRGSTYDDYDDEQSAYGTAPSSRYGEPRGLTESAVNSLARDDDLDWEDEDNKDARSERRSVKSGKSGKSERHRRKSERSRSKSREREREREKRGKEEKRESGKRESESSRGKVRSEDSYVRSVGEAERAFPDMGSFEQFPGQYSSGMMGQAGEADHMMSGGMGERPPSAPDQQFGPTREDSYGAAAAYYLDEGQSVQHQPGVRAKSPNMLVNPDHHLHAASLEAHPAEDTGQGSAADFYGGDIVMTEEPQPINKPGKQPVKSSSSSSKPSKPGRTSSLGTAAAATAALGMAAASSSSNNHQQSSSYAQQSGDSLSNKPGRQSSEQVSPGSVTPQYPNSSQQQLTNGSSYGPSPGQKAQGTPSRQSVNGTYYAAPTEYQTQGTPTRPVTDGSYYASPSGRQSEGKTGKYSSSHSNAGMYAAGAAAAGAAGYAAYEAKQHHDHKYSQSQHGGTQYSRPGYAPSAAYASGSYANMQQDRGFHEHKGPMTKLKDGFLNLLSTEEDVVKMEMYTEAIGVCKHCFDPRTSPWDAPRRHHYHAHSPRRDSFEDLRRRRSLDKMRKHGSRENLGGRIDKDSRYYSTESKRKSGSKSDLAAAGLAGVGLAAGANALFNTGQDFEDTYSVKSGHRASSAARRRSRSSSRENRRKATHGIVGREPKDEYVFVRTKDGRMEKRRARRSRSRSSDRRNGMMGAAAGAALGASAIGASSSRRRHSRSRSRSSSPGLANILGFSDSKSKRGRHSPTGSYYNISHDPRREQRQHSPGMLGGFFTSPPPKRRDSKREHQKKKKAGFFNFGNGSVSSSDNEMAFGEGFSSNTNLPLRRKSSNKSVKRKGSDQRIGATIAGIGATAAALAAAQKGHRVNKRTSRPDLKRRQVAQQQDSSDDEWEDELPSDASSGSSLAFGDNDYNRQLTRRESRDSINSNGSGAGGLGAWGWRWGGKKDRKKRRNSSPPPAYPTRPGPSIVGPAPAVGAAAIGAAALSNRDATRPTYDSRGSSVSGSQPPMQLVDPRPVSEESSVVGANRISMPGSFDDEPPVIRPGPSPIQQPKPIAPIQPAFTDRTNDDVFDHPTPRRTQSSPTQSSFGMKDAAMIGAAAIGAGSIIASQSGRRSKEPKDVRFGLTEEQQAKEDRGKQKAREKADRSERARADRERALKEEAERFTREQDVLRRREDENRRAAEARVEREKQAERERMDREAEAVREKERQEAHQREEARKAEELEYKRRREAEIEAELEAKRRELEETQRRKSESRDSQSDKKSERSSSIPWGAVAAGAAATAGAAYAVSNRDRSKSRDAKDRDSYTAREIAPARESPELKDKDVFDPEFFKRKRSPNRSPSGDRQIEEIARKAYEKIQNESQGAEDYDRMIAEREEYYHEPARSQADVFAPEEILARDAGYKERTADPIGDNEVRVARDADGHVFDEDLYGPKSFERSRHAPFGVPKLGLIAPTPPPEVLAREKQEKKKKRAQSPASKSEVGGSKNGRANDDDEGWGTKSEPGGRRSSRSRSISWGEPQTHVYEVRTPDSANHEADGYMDAKDVGTGAAAAAAAAGVGAAMYAASGKDDHDRDRKRRDGDFEEFSRAANDRESAKPFVAADIGGFGGFNVDSPGTEGAPPVRGYVEGELDQTPKAESGPHIPGSWDDEQKEGEYFDAQDAPSRTARDAPFEDEVPYELLSKKDKKKRDKANKQRAAALEEDLPTPPTAEPEPVVEAPAPVSEPMEEEVPYEMLSKKDKKKRDKAKRASMLEEDIPTPPAAETEGVIEPVVEAPAPPPVEDEIPYEMLSKKEKKKRDKMKRSMSEDFASPPAEPEPQPDTEPVVESPAPELVEEEVPYEMLSKKDKKKRDKLKRSMSEDVASPSAEAQPQPEPVVESPAAHAEEEEIPYEMLSKKDKKKRDKLNRNMSEDVASPTAELQAEPIAEPAAEQAEEDIPYEMLSKKDKKKRDKEAKKQGLADVATAAMTTAGIAAVAGAATEEGDSSENWDGFSTGKKGKKGKKAQQPIERDIRDIEPAADNSRSMPGGWGAEATTGSSPPPETVDPFQYQVKDDSPPTGTTPQEAAKEVDPMDEFAEVKGSSKKSKKKAKRDSLRFNEPEIGSPLRSEVAFDDYLAGGQAQAGAEANGLTGEEERSSRSTKYEVDDRPLTESPRRISPDDMRSVASEPTGARERRRRSRGDRPASEYYEEEETDPYDDVRSVAASEPADLYERRRSKRSSRNDDDDVGSVVSSSGRTREKEEDGGKKKTGFFGGLFGSKKSDPPSSSKSDVGTSLSRTSTRDSRNGYDDDGEKKHHRRKSEYGDDDDTRSVVSESRPRHHHRRRTDDEYPDRPTSESGSRHHSRRRTGDEYDAVRRSSSRDQDKDQSFLGMRVEGQPPLPADASASLPSAAVAAKGDRGLGSPGLAEGGKSNIGENAIGVGKGVFQGPGETVQAVNVSAREGEGSLGIDEVGLKAEPLERNEPTPGLVAAETRVPSVDEAVEYLPALPESPPDSPTEVRQHTPNRPAPLQRPISTTSVPLRFPFGQSPSTPGQGRMERAVSFGGHLPSTPTTPYHSSSHHKTRQGRPTSTEMMPLYLVERTRKTPEVEEQLPSLPSSKPSSRASSVVGSEEWEDAVEEHDGSPLSWRAQGRGLAIDTDAANAVTTPETGEDYLDSQQTTPKATIPPSDPFASSFGRAQWGVREEGRERPVPQFYTWADWEAEEGMRKEEQEDLPGLPESRPESRTAGEDQAEDGSGWGDAGKGVAAAALVGAGAVAGYAALKNRNSGDTEGEEEGKRELPISESSAAVSENEQPTTTSSKKSKKKGKKEKKAAAAYENALEESSSTAAVRPELLRQDTETFISSEKDMEEGAAVEATDTGEYFPPGKTNELDQFMETEGVLESGGVLQGEQQMERTVAEGSVDGEWFEAEDGQRGDGIGATTATAMPTERELPANEPSADTHLPHLEKQTSAGHEQDLAAVPAPVEASTAVDSEVQPEAEFAPILTAKEKKKAKKAGKKGMKGVEEMPQEDSSVPSEAVGVSAAFEETTAPEVPASDAVERDVGEPAQVTAAETLTAEPQADEEWGTLSRKQSKKDKRKSKQKQRLDDIFGEDAQTSEQAEPVSHEPGNESVPLSSDVAALVQDQRPVSVDVGGPEPPLLQQEPIDEATAAANPSASEAQPIEASRDISTEAIEPRSAQQSTDIEQTTIVEPEDEFAWSTGSKKKGKKGKKAKKAIEQAMPWDEASAPVSEASPVVEEDGKLKAEDPIVIDQEPTPASEEQRDLSGEVAAAQKETLSDTTEFQGLPQEPISSTGVLKAVDLSEPTKQDESATKQDEATETPIAAAEEVAISEQRPTAEADADDAFWAPTNSKKKKKDKKGKKAAAAAVEDSTPAAADLSMDETKMDDQQPTFEEPPVEPGMQTREVPEAEPSEQATTTEADADDAFWASTTSKKKKDKKGKKAAAAAAAAAALEDVTPAPESSSAEEPTADAQQITVDESALNTEALSQDTREIEAVGTTEPTPTAETDVDAFWAPTISKKKGKKGKKTAAALEDTAPAPDSSIAEEPSADDQLEKADETIVTPEVQTQDVVKTSQATETSPAEAAEPQDEWALPSSSKKKKKKDKKASRAIAETSLPEEERFPTTQPESTSTEAQDVPPEPTEQSIEESRDTVNADQARQSGEDDLWSSFLTKKSKKGKKAKKSGLETPVEPEQVDETGDPSEDLGLSTTQDAGLTAPEPVPADDASLNAALENSAAAEKALPDQQLQSAINVEERRVDDPFDTTAAATTAGIEDSATNIPLPQTEDLSIPAETIQESLPGDEQPTASTEPYEPLPFTAPLNEGSSVTPAEVSAEASQAVTPVEEDDLWAMPIKKKKGKKGKQLQIEPEPEVAPIEDAPVSTTQLEATEERSIPPSDVVDAVPQEPQAADEDFWAPMASRKKKGKEAKQTAFDPEFKKQIESENGDGNNFTEPIDAPQEPSAALLDSTETPSQPLEAAEDDFSWPKASKKKKGKKGRQLDPEPDDNEVDVLNVPADSLATPADAPVETSTTPLDSFDQQSRPTEAAEDDFWAPTISKKKKKGKKGKNVDPEPEPRMGSEPVQEDRSLGDATQTAGEVEAPIDPAVVQEESTLDAAPDTAILRAESEPVPSEPVEAAEDDFGAFSTKKNKKGKKGKKNLGEPLPEAVQPAEDLQSSTPIAITEESSVPVEGAADLQQIEAAEEDDFWAPTSKKSRKKGKKSNTLEQDPISDAAPIEDSAPIAADTVTEEPSALPEASGEPEQPTPAGEEDDFWASTSTKSKKKGKKSKTLEQDQTPAATAAEDSTSATDVVMEEPTASQETVTESQQTFPADEEDELWAMPAKKKKGKKGKKPELEPGVEESSTRELPADDTVGNDQAPIDADTVTASTDPPPTEEAGDEFWAAPSKKKKGKKGKKSGTQTPEALPEPESTGEASTAERSDGQPVLADIVDLRQSSDNATATTGQHDISSVEPALGDSGSADAADQELPASLQDFAETDKHAAQEEDVLTKPAADGEQANDLPSAVQDFVDHNADAAPSNSKDDMWNDTAHAATDLGSQRMALPISAERETAEPTEDADAFWSPTTKKKKKGKKGRQATTDSFNELAESFGAPEPATTVARGDSMDVDAPASSLPEDVLAQPDITGTATEDQDSSWSAPTKGKKGKKGKKDKRATFDFDEVPGENSEANDEPGKEWSTLPTQPAKEASIEAQDVASSADVPAETLAQTGTKLVEPSRGTISNEDTRDTTGEDANFEFSTKKSKKDKKAKKSKAADPWPEEPVDAHQDPSFDDTGILANAGTVGAGALAAGAIAASTANASEENPKPDEEEWPTFSTKKSKKDKRKGKKSGTATPATPTEAQPEDLAAESMDLDNREVAVSETQQDALADQDTGFSQPILEDDNIANESLPTVEKVEPTTQEAERAPEIAQTDGQRDIDFAATVAAGLQDTGFDPDMVVNDPVFHRRATPPGATGEADPEEVFESFSKKREKKGKRGKQAESASEEQSRDASGFQTPENTANDFDQVLAQSLQGTGVDPTALEQNKAGENAYADELTGEGADFSFATTRKKRGKKNARAIDEEPAADTSAQTTNLDSTPDDYMAQNVHADDILQTKDIENTQAVSEDTATQAEPQEELSRHLTIDTNTTEATSALTTTPGTPLLDPAADLVHAGDRDMDVDDMDAAYRAYKRNKRKQKKQKWASMQAEETPQLTEGTTPVGETSDQIPITGQTSNEASDAVRGQADGEGVQQADFVQDSNHERSMSGPEAAGLGAAGIAAAIGAGTSMARSSSRQRDRSAHSPRLEGKRSLGLLPNDKSPSAEDKEHQIIRDSGYQETSSPRLSRQSADSSSRALPGIRSTQSKESLHSRRSNEALYISTDTGPEWDLKTPKRRSADPIEDSRTLHARTPSQNTQDTPLESTSRNRASYLFQSTPENLRSASFEDTPTQGRERDAGEYFPSNGNDGWHGHERSSSNPDRAAFSPPPSGMMSPRIPLHTIPEEHLAHKRSIGEIEAKGPTPDHKSIRRSETPQSIRARERAFSPNGLPPLQTGSASGRSVSNPGIEEVARQSDMRSPSVMSNRSNVSANQWKSPDELRSYSRASNRSNTPSLRRTSLSGDLRAASRRGDSGSAVGARSSPKTIPFEAPPTPPINDDEVMDEGASRSRDMSDVYQGYGDAQASQVSPTRPPSMRKRQSMHIMDLESKLEHLAAENEALQSAKQANGSSRGLDGQNLEEALQARDLELQQKDNEISQIRAMLQPMQEEIARLNDMNNGLTEANRNLVDDSNGRYSTLQQEHADAHEQWQNASRELEGLRQEHGQLTSGLRAAVEAELATALASKNSEIRELKEELEVATEKIRALQVQIQSTKGRDFLTVRDEDYFDGACQKLCQHVQQWVLRFSKVSDNRICRISTDLKDDKIEARLDNAVLDGSDVDKLLGDRVRRRDVFMSVVMTMVWEYVFTRYLFGMDREQRQKLKTLEKLLSEVGPPRAVAQWRATTLTLLAKRPAFAEQRDRDTQAVASEIFDLLCALLPPPSNNEQQLLQSLQKVIHVAVDLSVEMRTQRSEYIMLPPLLPEYDTNGDLMHKVHFNASLMNERSGMFSSNEELESSRAVVKIVLFPLVVKKGDEVGEGEEEIVVCPAQVLVQNDDKRGKKVVRVESGHLTLGSRQSFASGAGSLRNTSRQSFASGGEGNAF